MIKSDIGKYVGRSKKRVKIQMSNIWPEISSIYLWKEQIIFRSLDKFQSRHRHKRRLIFLVTKWTLKFHFGCDIWRRQKLETDSNVIILKKIYSIIFSKIGYFNVRFDIIGWADERIGLKQGHDLWMVHNIPYLRQ